MWYTITRSHLKAKFYNKTTIHVGARFYSVPYITDYISLKRKQHRPSLKRKQHRPVTGVHAFIT